MLRTFISASTSAMIPVPSVFALAGTGTPGMVKSGYAPVNGLKMYYEIHGAGQPVILLHGGVGATKCSTRLYRCWQKTIK
jgi:hypothetical protein